MSAAYNIASELPQEVRLRAESSGAGGIDWMNSLQGKIEYLALKWGFRPGLVLTGGSESLILNVELDDGSAAVLKIGLPMYCDCANSSQSYKAHHLDELGMVDPLIFVLIKGALREMFVQVWQNSKKRRSWPRPCEKSAARKIR